MTAQLLNRVNAVNADDDSESFINGGICNIDDGYAKKPNHIDNLVLNSYNRNTTLKLPSNSINLISRKDDFATSSIHKITHGEIKLGSKLVKKSTEFYDKNNTLFIVDYDDTLFPTHWIASNDASAILRTQHDIISDYLYKLASQVIETLKKCMSLGNLIIVTNASFEWVYKSAEKHMPTLLDFFIKNRIKIISTRDRYIGEAIPQKNWKYVALMQLVQQLFSEQLCRKQECSVVSIGDGDSERDACLEIAKNFNSHGWKVKIVKFIYQPTCKSLILQHQLIEKNINQILHTPNSLDMEVKVDLFNTNSVEITHRIMY
ncbi:HAD domain ookinete protein, putative (HADO) [Babesia microti strain RI]|uniref:HAD domain ookinete protein, putative (HADO) n=1 Tax=Babesia microti (strain RI) TaxID=1133968 RepID=I7J5F4_BABMR|nr:HAD domain ookinete protein, putative (HADO) [Babesia microti strain RI]CCF72827.1 HAD domain ookinete protein, putative (HADO) [Babesia microti strain RI]|eukprot:XP_012647436.1 HAD domain ookinete protein, putative (HADO) [Babesia microti strain RI]